MRDTLDVGIIGNPHVPRSCPSFVLRGLFTGESAYKRGTTYASGDGPRPLPLRGGRGEGCREGLLSSRSAELTIRTEGHNPQPRTDPAPAALEGRPQVPPSWFNSSAQLLSEGEGRRQRDCGTCGLSGPGNQVRIRSAGPAKSGGSPRGTPSPGSGPQSGPPGRGSHNTYYRTLGTEGPAQQPFSPGRGVGSGKPGGFRLDSLSSSDRIGHAELEASTSRTRGAASPAGRPPGPSGSPGNIFVLQRR